MTTRHTPEYAVPDGRDPQGNYHFKVESGSVEGLWYDTIIWTDGTDGICTCQAYDRHGYCTMTRSGPALIELYSVMELINQLIDTAMGLRAGIADHGGDYELDQPTARRAAELEARADKYLESQVA